MLVIIINDLLYFTSGLENILIFHFKTIDHVKKELFPVFRNHEEKQKTTYWYFGIIKEFGSNSNWKSIGQSVTGIFWWIGNPLAKTPISKNENSMINFQFVHRIRFLLRRIGNISLFISGSYLSPIRILTDTISFLQMRSDSIFDFLSIIFCSSINLRFRWLINTELNFKAEILLIIENVTFT